MKNAGDSVSAHEWELGRVLWDYLKLGEHLFQADAIIVMGSNDIRVAERGVTIAASGLSSTIVLCGGRGNFTSADEASEASMYAKALRRLGVNMESVVLEDKSTNTAENLTYALAALDRIDEAPSRLILVHKPFMERRAKATADIVMPRVITRVSSPCSRYDDYPNDILTPAHIVTAMVGDLDRILVYPAHGYQTKQYVPPVVLAASSHLKALGYTGHAIS